jgi:isopenicillin N synthase-like dioxygenase
MKIETLDFSKFHVGTDAERYEFSTVLLKGFANTGFVKLINHGFSQEEISQLFDEVRSYSSISLFDTLTGIEPTIFRFD